jgi:hypothetical protein
MQEIKTFWVDAEDYIEEKGGNMVKPVLSAEDFKNEVDEKFGMRRMINAMTEYLQASLYFESLPLTSSMMSFCSSLVNRSPCVPTKIVTILFVFANIQSNQEAITSSNLSLRFPSERQDESDSVFD